MLVDHTVGDLIAAFGGRGRPGAPDAQDMTQEAVTPRT
jgi:hypothetical protein